MFAYCQTREGIIHSITYTNLDGMHFTMCELKFNKKQILSSFSLDNLIDEMCPKCYQECNSYFTQEHPRDVRSRLVSDLVFSYKHTVGAPTGVKYLYQKLANKRWYKLTKYRGKLARKH